MYVLLIGGASGIGKTALAVSAGRCLGVPWLGVDDLRLALARSGVAVPDADAAPTFDAPGGLLDLAELMTPAIEAVVENHVDQRMPVVIEGDAILPSLLERPEVRARADTGAVRAVFLYEPDEGVLRANMRARGRGFDSREGHARKNWSYGEWIRREAERRGLPTVPARPWETLVDRAIAEIDRAGYAGPRPEPV